VRRLVTLEDRIAELEAENAWLKDQLAERFRPDAVLAPALGLTGGQSAILLMLYAARGRVVSKHFMDDQMTLYKNKERMSDRAIEVQIHHLRRKIGYDLIKNVWGLGYLLTEEGRRLVGEALGAS
jgi:DNA-binding response OmpR family regulator